MNILRAAFSSWARVSGWPLRRPRRDSAEYFFIVEFYRLTA
jgi:hypothetical protein